MNQLVTVRGLIWLASAFGLGSMFTSLTASDVTEAKEKTTFAEKIFWVILFIGLFITVIFLISFLVKQIKKLFYF